ncbi:hypothetical protein AVEN_167567-1 [Araneus ventricosus]|uniref:Uncharacterized protein n=1 Tax=Araneus ventricosus TaxID=182803 RepID=A0A4Y2SCR4_ARAVE|nr:hypothetical protein AVEN_167567-1 [Araneus ventricosus]
MSNDSTLEDKCVCLFVTPTKTSLNGFESGLKIFKLVKHIRMIVFKIVRRYIRVVRKFQSLPVVFEIYSSEVRKTNVLLYKPGMRLFFIAQWVVIGVKLNSTSTRNRLVFVGKSPSQ